MKIRKKSQRNILTIFVLTFEYMKNLKRLFNGRESFLIFALVGHYVAYIAFSTIYLSYNIAPALEGYSNI